MQPGELRHRITIQRKSSSQDDWGEPIDEWSDVWTNVPAKIEASSGREFWSAQQVQAEVITEITIRWRDGVTPMHRIIHQTSLQAAVSPQELTIYDILGSIEDTTGRRWLTLACVRRSNPGFRSGNDPTM